MSQNQYQYWNLYTLKSDLKKTYKGQRKSFDNIHKVVFAKLYSQQTSPTELSSHLLFSLSIFTK